MSTLTLQCISGLLSCVCWVEKEREARERRERGKKVEREIIVNVDNKNLFAADTAMFSSSQRVRLSCEYFTASVYIRIANCNMQGYVFVYNYRERERVRESVSECKRESVSDCEREREREIK
jgi:hypothetical protein